VSAKESILVGCLGSVAWVRVDGPANQENAGQIREFLRGRFESGWSKFVIDLQDCIGIDSTFIGMLYRLAVDVMKKMTQAPLMSFIPEIGTRDQFESWGLIP
jgi:anti-sigma B factor antagonist